MNRGRYASSVSCAHCPRVTMRGLREDRVRPGDVVDVDRRDAGEVGVGEPHLGLDVGLGPPPVAPSWANWRAASQLSGPWPCSALARSPNIGNPEKGFGVAPPLVVGSVALVRPGSSAITAMLRRTPATTTLRRR